MKTAVFCESLLYYDGEQLFTATDHDDTYLLCLVNEKERKYVGVKISEKDLEGVKNGTKDVSRIYTSPKSKLLYPCVFGKGNTVKLHFLSTKDLIKEFLCPKKGLFLTPQE